MYALHPGSLPPKSPLAHERTEVTAEDLMALYGIAPEDCIVWANSDGYDWFDFIHIYPSYYDRYTLQPNGTPEKDIPDASHTRTSSSHTLPARRNAAKSSRAHDR